MPYLDSTAQRLPYESTSETSREAAQAAQVFAGAQGQRYLRWLSDQGLVGGTDKEAHAALGLERSSICARRDEWVKAGRVVKTDRRRDKCAVWVVLGEA